MSHSNGGSHLRAPACPRRSMTGVLLALLLTAPSAWAPRLAAAEIRPDYQFFHDPDLERPVTTRKFDERLSELWLEALNRPEIDLQRMVCESIVRGVKIEVPGLDACIGRLRELLTADQTQPVVRSAVAKALVALAAHDAAEDLALAANRYSGDVRQTCERALGDWRYEPIRPEWLARLDSPTVRHRDLILAIRGLGLAEVQPASDRLIGFLRSARAASEVRVEAALALGRIHHDGMVELAESLLEPGAGGTIVDRLCAARLLAEHHKPEAHGVLLRLAADPEPAVRAEALRLLNGIDSNLVLPLAEEAMKHPDHLVRRQGMIAFTRLPTPERMAPVSNLLDDLIPDLRREVCQRFDELLARPELVSAIWGATSDVLGRDGWRGQEQAALLVGQHRYQPASPRLLELQSVPRAEARVAAAWALRRVAVPETCAPILARARQLTDQRMTGPAPDQVDEQVGHLFEALAMMSYWQAESLWRQYVPK
ncbi:MAG: HEAT repeat domain-containing protein, partial [Planctomycetaceae bacterium]